MTVVAFDVVGDPTPQGSKQVFNDRQGRARSKESGGKRLATWRADVAGAAQREAQSLPGPLDGPLSLSVVFRFRMPISRPASIRLAGLGWRATTPDADKLLRAVCDALKTGGLVADDARFCLLRVAKVETKGGATGASIRVATLSDTVSLTWG